MKLKRCFSLKAQRMALVLAILAVGVWMMQGEESRWKRADEIVAAADSDWIDAPKIAITFDDGPHPKYTPQLLDGLKERQVCAAFFLIGENAEQYPELVLREHQEGHIVGNHTYHHVDLNKVSNDTAEKEIRMTNELLERITGEVPIFLRPPFGIRKK